MKRICVVIVALLVASGLNAQQKLLTEVTITYKVESADSLTSLPMLFKNAYEQLTIKGRRARTDLVAGSYKQTIIADNLSGTALVGKEIGNQKYLYELSADEWQTNNSEYDSLSVRTTDEHINILGYDCIKVVSRLKNGNDVIFYCATQLTTTASVIPRLYTLLPGVPLAYEMHNPAFKQKIRFVATDINLGTVPGNRMELDRSQYRKMN